MGSSKPEKKIKKIKKHRRKLVEKGEGAGGAYPLEYDDSPIVEKNKDDVAGADRKAYKSKKAHNNKSKDNPPSSESSRVVNDKVDAEDSSRGEKVFLPINGNSKKARKKKKDALLTDKKSKAVKEVQEAAVDDVYQISAEEEGDFKGMRKWIKDFHDRRLGLKVLQEQIDNFIAAHEEQEEEARRMREAKIAEDGWTVVVHRKGGKRTTDPESGVAVGSVAEAAVRDKLAKKKNKDVGLDFYRFQRKEAHRSEVMKLQSKFEEDKKRIQQIRAARKFKPY